MENVPMLVLSTFSKNIIDICQFLRKEFAYSHRECCQLPDVPICMESSIIFKTITFHMMFKNLQKKLNDPKKQFGKRLIVAMHFSRDGVNA